MALIGMAGGAAEARAGGAPEPAAGKSPRWTAGLPTSPAKTPGIAAALNSESTAHPADLQASWQAIFKALSADTSSASEDGSSAGGTSEAPRSEPDPASEASTSISSAAACASHPRLRAAIAYCKGIETRSLSNPRSQIQLEARSNREAPSTPSRALLSKVPAPTAPALAGLGSQPEANPAAPPT